MAKPQAIGEKSDREWEIERAANTLMEAARIKRTPKLFKAAVTELKRRSKELASVVGSKGE